MKYTLQEMVQIIMEDILVILKFELSDFKNINFRINLLKSYYLYSVSLDAKCLSPVCMYEKLV